MQFSWSLPVGLQPNPVSSLPLHRLPLTLLDCQLPHFTEEETKAQKLLAQLYTSYKLQRQDPI